ncbi:MAG: hypothetical protein HXL38_001740 [Candidatus Saccharimonas sp.]|nr:MAG: hypothetical protein HXL38_001740 [Candidatus Saccharimonas sp.]
MLKLFKTNNIEVLYDSKSDELKKKIVEQIMNLQILTRGSYSQEEFDSKKEWFFIRKNNEVTTAVGFKFLKEIQADKKSINVYALSDFVNAATTAPKANSNELTELFSEVVKYAKNNSKIDYLVCAIPQKINARPLARAGFNAKLFKNSHFYSSGLINELSNHIILNSEEKLSKSEILTKIRSEEQSRRMLFKKTPKSLARELRIIHENRKFIEKHKDLHAYYGLIAGLNVKK